MTAIKRKFLMPALLSAITVAGVASCSTGGAGSGAESAAEKEAAAAAKQVAAPSTGAATGDPFAGMSAEQIARKAVKATRGAKSLRLTAEGTENGRRLKVDFSLDSKGTCAGGLRQDDSEAEFAVVDGVTYVKGDDEFWRALATGGNDPNSQSADPGRADALVLLLKGKWLKIPAGGNAPARALGGACDLDAMLGNLNTADTKGLTRGNAAEVDGRKAVTLVKRDADRTRTTFVAAEGAPYLLKAVSEGGRAPNTVVFGDFGVPVKATVPPEGDVVDLREVQGAANPPAGL
ncbi:hypothetical protein GCM10011583_69220 [Streptomyces camponoticapitis]|uniref:Lipoprotein n=1 Tax=Streptomyces camponoticapitis TaxID=1616125 RepID=A0ABQ2EUS9_9ACTN|nr:hypothetical protein [Streptomyces camponoticapitis]GGK27346.1 hypothetical protein GCM10011583_69220 [Streptomyces camponoticapitis]